MAPLPQLDPDERDNAYLQGLVQRLHPEDHPPFVRKLTTQPLRERFHTYRELLLGAQLRMGGADFRYERMIDGQTPDWSLFDGQTLIEVVDVVTFHQRNDKEREIASAIHSTSTWAGWITIPPDHIYRKLSDKAGQYATLAQRIQTPYVLAVFGDFLASLDPVEMERVLYTQHGGWFANNPVVSGVIYFREQNFKFEFIYFANPTAWHRPAIYSSSIGRWSQAHP